MILLSCGNNCTCSEIVRFFSEYIGNSVTDWTFCSAKTMVRILALVYVVDDLEILTDLFLDWENVGMPRKVYNRLFDVSAPHHVPSEDDEELAKYFHLKHYSSLSHTRDKILRRFQRLRDILAGPEPVLFLFTDFREDIVENPANLDKLYHIVRLFRPDFQIVYIGKEDWQSSDKFDTHHISIGDREVEKSIDILVENYGLIRR